MEYQVRLSWAARTLWLIRWLGRRSTGGGRQAIPLSRVPTIVLTGGPGGGKSTLMRELRVEDPHTRRWILVPEAAPLLFQAGLHACTKSFQQAVVCLQMALEQCCATVARPGQVLVCHRGTLDPLAYWLRNGWEERDFFTCTQMSRDEHCQRYWGVLHFQTAAIGAEPHYRRWPDAHRPETLAQAAAMDRLCAHAWSAHPQYGLIDNAGRDWRAKAQAAQALIHRWRAALPGCGAPKEENHAVVDSQTTAVKE